MTITPHKQGSVYEKRRFTTRKKETKELPGIMAIGLIVMWINFIPFNGPALPLINITSNFYPQLFVVTHICGLLGSSYYLACLKKTGFSKTINTISPAVLALLTAILIITSMNNMIVLAFIFISFGLLSGWIVSHWMAWFLSDFITGRRGSVFGKSLAVTYIFIALTTLVLTQFSEGVIYALTISAIIVLIGGYLNSSLPITEKLNRHLTRKELVKIIPPVPLILFALFGYSVVALTYRLIISWGLKEPVLPWLLIIPYTLIGLLFGPYSDRSGRDIIFILAFLCTGLGFLILIVATDQPVIQILTGLLINSGLLFIHLYYWLSLADYQDPRFSPLTMAIGISIELAIFSFSYALVDFFTDKPDLSIINIGLTGVALILIGFALIAGLLIRRYSKTSEFERSNIPFTNALKIGLVGKSPVSKAYHFAFIEKDKFISVVVEQYCLTKKEADIAYMISTGYSNHAIMVELQITANTLKYHLKNIYSKLYVSSREEAKNKLYNTFGL